MQQTRQKRSARYILYSIERIPAPLRRTDRAVCNGQGAGKAYDTYLCLRNRVYTAEFNQACGGRPIIVYVYFSNDERIPYLQDVVLRGSSLSCRSKLNSTETCRTSTRMSSLNLTNIASQMCAVDAIVNSEFEQLCGSISLDPHTDAELSLDKS